MTMRKCKPFGLKILIILLILCNPFILFADDSVWMIACDRFSSVGKDTSVSNALGELLPNLILENLEEGKSRTISPEENFSRIAYKLKNDRVSLFLQLEAALKTRDSLLLKDVNEAGLKKILRDEEKKIEEIREKINQNIAELKEAEEKSYSESVESMFSEKIQLSEGQKYLKLFKGLVSTENNDAEEETVSLYGNNDSHFVSSASENYVSRDFIKQMQSSGIKALLTGKIKIMGDFMMVTSELYMYPSAKVISTVTEVGNVSDSDLMARNMARALSPVISASFPVDVYFTVTPEEALEKFTFVVDDVVYNDISQKIVLDAGVHSIRFDSPGFRTASTSYFFEGNRSYHVEVEMKEDFLTQMEIKFPASVYGSFTLNGAPAGNITSENSSAKISVNGTQILGNFISDDGPQGFFFIPEKLVENFNVISVKPKLFDKSEYIDKRRKMMYTSYSVFLISLLGSIFIQGNQTSVSQALYINPDNMKLQNDLDVWNKAYLGAFGVTICSGGWFIFELTRYFLAADTVLPVKAK